ncbi:MAG: superoxide dismutase [Alphaproteobacteria bacterium]|nr:superoxide dismutase [Alphaproteobacteria bacterium]
MAAGFPRLATAQAQPFEFMKLPYADDALAPVISANTMGFHYGRHHKGYLDNLNNLVRGSDLANQSLIDVVKASMMNPTRAAIFNNAAQVWNHDFYWKSMRPGGGGRPSGKLMAAIESDLGGWDKFRADFAAFTVGQFASGWGWLVADKGKLRMVRTSNADTPQVQGMTALVTIDVWEHAYYLDYQNRRADYVAAVLDKLIDWDFAAENLARAG